MGTLKIVDIVKKFKGDVGEDVELWLDRLWVAIDMTAKAGASLVDKEKEMARVMPLFLDGRAYRTWKQIPETNRKNLKAVKAALLSTFGKTKVVAWEELKALRYFPGESIDVLVDDAESLLQIIVGGPPPGELVSLFVLDALPREIADQVRLHHGKDLTLADVASCAKSLTAVPARGVVAAVNTPNISGDQLSSKQRTVRCFKCGLLGHVARNCRTVCHGCGQHGHIQRDCARAKPNSIEDESAGHKESGNATVRQPASSGRAVLTLQTSSGEFQSTATPGEL